MRKNRFLSLLMMAAMLATTAVFTACSSDDDSPKNDPNVIIAGENDPLGQPIGLVYTDFLTPNDVTHNADTTELSISKALADKKVITNFVNRPMGIWDDQQHRSYLRRATEQRLEGDRYVLKVVRSSVAEVINGQEVQLNTHLYYNPGRMVTRGGLTRASMGAPEADKYVDDNNVIHPAAITLCTKPNSGANSADLDLSQAGRRTITIEDMFNGKTDGANSWFSDLWDDIVDTFEDAWDAIVDATSYDWDPHNNWSLLKSKTTISSDVKFNCGEQPGDTITLRLRCPIEFNLDYTLNIDSHGSIETAFVPVLDYLETYVEGYLDVNPQARIGFSKTITLPEDKQRIRLFQFSGVGFTFMLGPVPLTVDIDPSVYLKFTSTLKGNAYLGVQYDIATKFKAGFRYSNGSLSGIADGEKVKDEFSFINPKAELELNAGVGLFFGCDIVIEKIGGPTFNIGPQVNITGKLSYQMGDDRINASIEGKAGVGGEIGAVLKVFGYQIADWRTYFDIGPQWQIFKYPDDGSGSSGNYDPNYGGGGTGGGGSGGGGDDGEPALGDLYYSDGTYSKTLEPGKTPIGVIAYLDNWITTDDDEIVEKGNGGGHGLVLCLKNAASAVPWSWEYVSKFPGQEVTNLAGLMRTTNVSGYRNTATLTADADKYPAAAAAKNYKGLPAPAGTTGWFLPSAQQWVKMMTGLGGLKASDISKWWDWFDTSHTAVDNWEAAFKKAGSGNYDSMIPHLCYWSSSESSDEGALGLYVDAAGPVGDCGFYWSHNYKNRRYDDYRVRPVLAF